MVDFPRFFRLVNNDGRADNQGGAGVTVGVMDGAIGGAEQFASIAAHFPDVAFESVGDLWPERTHGLDILIVAVDASRRDEVEAAGRRLAGGGRTQVVIVLNRADVGTTRNLMRAGAADVVPGPISEPALALCLERLLAHGEAQSGPKRRTGELIAVLKAGGGVGATSLSVQMAMMLAGRMSGEVCVADLDLQFGSAAVYLDLPDAVTIADCLGSGTSLVETPFATALARHRTGVRLLAAPREIVSLDSLSATQASSLAEGLRRDFALTFVDLPPVWTDWSNQIVAQASGIVLVTNLTVPHMQLAKRQLRVLASQQLDDSRLLVVCNGLSSDQTTAISLKAAERALGRPIDIVVPEDRRLMTATLNQGVELASVKRGAKLEKAVGELAARVAAHVGAGGGR